MLKYFQKRKYNIVGSVIAFVSMWLIWFIAYLVVDNSLVIPSISQTFLAIGDCLISAIFWRNFAYTFLRTIITFLLSWLIALFMAILSYQNKIIKSIIVPIVSVLRTVPTMAILLLILIWATPNYTPMIVTALVLFPLGYSRFCSAIEGVDIQLLEMAKVYEISKKDQIKKIYLPQSLPVILSQWGSDFSFALKIMVSAEVMSNTYKSLGGMIQQSKIYLEIPTMMALTIITIIVGILCDLLLSQCVHVTDRWRIKEV